MAWIEVHQTLRSHRKVLRLKSALKLRASHTVGHLVFLWLWALDNAKDGDLSGVSPEILAQAADYNPRKAETFVEALVEAGFLDRKGDRLVIHDWEDFGGRLQEQRKRNAERKRRSREKQKEATLQTGTETSAAVTDIHNTTLHNTTLHDTTNSYSGGGGEGAGGAQERLRAYLLGQGLLPEEYLGADPELIGQCRELCRELFRSFADRSPTALDFARVFCAVTALEDGRRRLDPDQQEVLSYAFQQAARNGRGGAWPYIEGVLGRLHQRGIRSAAEAEDYDWERQAGRG